ncbi:MAG: hypothetical protein WAV95_16800 [Azonexus sp.]
MINISTRNISPRHGSHFAALLRRAMLAVTLGSAISLLAAAPAMAERNDRQGRDQQRAEQQRDHRQSVRDRQRDHRHYRQQSRYVRPYYYAQPVYVPPPVYYEPQQSPGITLFFPLDLRR